jgi:hypothetical protein
MLTRVPIIRITTAPNCVEPLTLDQCHAKAFELAQLVTAAKRGLLLERVRLGCFLIQVKAGLEHGRFGMWLASGTVHQKVAERCMRLAAACGEEGGTLDRRRLFELLHNMDAHAFPSIETFDEHRVSLRRVEVALGIRERTDGTNGTNSTHGSNSPANERLQRMGLNELPKARVDDASGQGVLDIFAPFVRTLEGVAKQYGQWRGDDTKRHRAAEIIHRCERELAELMVDGGGRE